MARKSQIFGYAGFSTSFRKPFLLNGLARSQGRDESGHVILTLGGGSTRAPAEVAIGGLLPLDILQERWHCASAPVEYLGEDGMSPSVEILQGTLDLLVLKTLALEPMHGWGIAQRIQQ